MGELTGEDCNRRIAVDPPSRAACTGPEAGQCDPGVCDTMLSPA